MSDDDIREYRLAALERNVAEIKALLEAYRRNVFIAVIGGGALANFPIVDKLLSAIAGSP